MVQVLWRGDARARIIPHQQRVIGERPAVEVLLQHDPVRRVPVIDLHESITSLKVPNIGNDARQARIPSKSAACDPTKGSPSSPESGTEADKRRSNTQELRAQSAAQEQQMNLGTGIGRQLM